MKCLTNKHVHTGYKLTDQQMQTYDGSQWELGVTKRATGAGNESCTDGVLHYYSDPLLAVLLNPTHAQIKSPRLFKVECSEKLGTDGLKYWCKEQMLVKELELPAITITQRVAFAIHCAYPTASAEWQFWADAWLAGKDRTAATAAAAYTNTITAATIATNAAVLIATFKTANAANTVAVIAAVTANTAPKFLLSCARKAMRVKISVEELMTTSSKQNNG